MEPILDPYVATDMQDKETGVPTRYVSWWEKQLSCIISN